MSDSLLNKQGGKVTFSRFAPPIFFVLLILTFLIAPVRGSVPLNITGFDVGMSEALGFSDSGFVGGMILSAILMMCLILPIALITRKSKGTYGFYPELAMTILGLVLSVGIGWLHYWVLLVTALLIALFFAYSMRGLISGGS